MAANLPGMTASFPGAVETFLGMVAELFGNTQPLPGILRAFPEFHGSRARIPSAPALTARPRRAWLAHRRLDEFAVFLGALGIRVLRPEGTRDRLSGLLPVSEDKPRGSGKERGGGAEPEEKTTSACYVRCVFCCRCDGQGAWLCRVRA